MTGLMIQNSNLICYKVVTDSTGKKYLMDLVPLRQVIMALESLQTKFA